MSKPVVSVEGCEAPEELVIIDEKVGDGDEAKAGDVVDVHYVGVGLSDGKQFDASW
ncbi:MAG: FKBP-type peptidyl-prolyl cis-trans isomerase, partial [Dermabacter sp.]|nr:FKBP-type peptidyl-prolyl cis-trans isomerase [Dermabacter sp.]